MHREHPETQFKEFIWICLIDCCHISSLTNRKSYCTL